MSEHVATQIVFLFEHELVQAGKAVRKFHELHTEGSEASEDARLAAMHDLINSCTAALWDVTGEAPLMLTNAKQLFAGRKAAKEPKG